MKIFQNSLLRWKCHFSPNSTSSITAPLRDHQISLSLHRCCLVPGRVTRTKVRALSCTTLGSMSSCSRGCRRSREKWIERISHHVSMDLQHMRLKDRSLRSKTSDRAVLGSTERLIPISFQVVGDLNFSIFFYCAYMVSDFCDFLILAQNFQLNSFFINFAPKP